MGSKNRLKKRQALAAQRSKQTAEQDRRREARPGCRCWRSWNVSRIDPPGKQTYLCPDCRSAPWEGCEGDKQQNTTGGEPR